MKALCALVCNTNIVVDESMKKIGQVMTVFEIVCLELIGFKKSLVKYFLCGILSVLS